MICAKLSNYLLSEINIEDNCENLYLMRLCHCKGRAAGDNPKCFIFNFVLEGFFVGFHLRKYYESKLKG